jgi:Cellulose synthase
VPYFFELDSTGQNYGWAKVAFVQTPQRFSVADDADDPLGNHAAIQYDVINHGKDGIGAVSSSGQGSLWRVAALKGVAADGTQVHNSYYMFHSYTDSMLYFIQCVASVLCADTACS